MVTDDALLNQELLTPGLIGRLAHLMLKNGFFMATAESCTGGMIAAACTDLAGSSNWFDRGFVTYSNAAKTELLGVDEKLIATHGAVSGEVARAMAAGALARSRAQVAVAVTGVAGPGGGTAAKPVGTVWFGFGLQPTAAAGTGKQQVPKISVEHRQFAGDRAAVRTATVTHALQGLMVLLQTGD
jgi:nicotinamide-nucleotide amidase